MENHTPGPWKSFNTGDMAFVVADNYETPVIICRVENYVRQVPLQPDDHANVKLLSACPEMLEVLQKFMDFKDSDYVPNGLFDRAATVIKKATGK